MRDTVAISSGSSPDLLKSVGATLGIRSLASDQALAIAVEQRLPLRSLEGLRRRGLSDDEIHALVLPRRTLAHRRTRREALSRDESDRVVRLARIAALAEGVFGERARAWRWLRNAKERFGGRAPLQIMVTEAGARLVEEWLYAIDDGMAA